MDLKPSAVSSGTWRVLRVTASYSLCSKAIQIKVITEMSMVIFGQCVVFSKLILGPFQPNETFPKC